MPRILRRLTLVAALSAPLAGACGDDPPPSVLAPSDLELPEDEELEFDRNDLIADPELTDADALDVRAIQNFLKQTPYGQRSFLVTYQSNGVRAADAIVNAARQYRLNPILFLVYAQATQGLVSATTYPFPPERVEYAFGCGALSQRSFDPNLGGLDHQLDCLGRALRAAIDDVQANQSTAAGWGVDQSSVTLDNVEVTPATVATAALYDRTPRVNVGKAGGTWILWNLWTRYKLEVGYIGAFGTADGKWIGEPCETSAMCSGLVGENVLCAEPPEYPGGSCIVACSEEEPCPSLPDKPESFCARFDDGAYCLPVCNPQAPSCRDGYACNPVPGLRSGDSNAVCTPSP